MEPKDQKQNPPDPQEENPGHLVTPGTPGGASRPRPDVAHDRPPKPSTSVNDDDGVTREREDDPLKNPRTGPIG